MASPTLRSVHTGVTVKIDVNKFSIGRSLSCCLVLEDLSISRVHCTIEKIVDAWCLSDESSNFTLLNGIAVAKGQRHWLKNCDKIKLSTDYEYEFTLDDICNPVPHTSNDDTIINVSDTYTVEDNNIANAPTAAMSANPVSSRATRKKKFGNSEVIDLSTSVEEKPPAGSPRSQQCKVKSGKLSLNLDSPKPSTSKKEGDSLNEIQEELICSICTEVFIKPVILNCQHSFCAYCIKMWRKGSNICPVCRGKITAETPSLTLNNIVEKVLESVSLEERKHREELVLQREKAMKEKPKRKTKAAKKTIPVSARRRQAEAPIVSLEISSSSDDYDDMDGNDSWDYEFEEEYYHAGIPGQYFGGYGECYICHLPGHWANGCPTRNG